MPVYHYECDKCGRTERELTTSVNEEYVIPSCCDQEMGRDYAGGGGKVVTGQYEKPILSEALAVTPGQIPDMMTRYPNREYTPDGRLVLRNHYERNKILRQEQMHDNV